MGRKNNRGRDIKSCIQQRDHLCNRMEGGTHRIECGSGKAGERRESGPTAPVRRGSKDRYREQGRQNVRLKSGAQRGVWAIPRLLPRATQWMR